MGFVRPLFLYYPGGFAAGHMKVLKDKLSQAQNQYMVAWGNKRNRGQE